MSPTKPPPQPTIKWLSKPLSIPFFSNLQFHAYDQT
jgi:hypothetical protein